jgi:phosphatidate phosphatase APP1
LSWLERLNDLAAGVRDTLAGEGSIVLIGSDGPIEIDAYAGYGNERRVLVQGRVMRARNIGPAGERDSPLRNLASTYKRIRAYPIPRAKLEVTVGATRAEFDADGEGFFRAWIDLEEPLATAEPWAEARLRLRDHDVTAAAPIRIATPEATFGVISDLDDTVIQSRVTNFLLAVRTIMLGNARTRLPFPGVASLYQALERGGDGRRRNPFYYVSSSPWNLHDLIAEFLELHGIPRGPVCLRDWEVKLDALSSSRIRQHKAPLIREIIDATDPLPFILVGDSSQQDPEIYAEVVRACPRRILAVYIRNVGADAGRTRAIEDLAREVERAGSALVLADDSEAASRHAAGQGWIQ